MIKLESEKNCCGCAACSLACPVDCIKMEEGTIGHLFPNVNVKMCINCGKCERVCPMIEPPHNFVEFKKQVFAAFSKDEYTRFSGSSGGMFRTFASKLLAEGCVVYGAAFDDSLNLKCQKAKNESELEPLLKSKYLQSNLSEKYLEIKEELDNNVKVLFVSTPCQVAALKKYLNKDYPNLITVDFFCHGVPSQDFFNKCLDFVERKRNISIINYQFRAKIRNGSTPHYYKMDFVKDDDFNSETKLYFNSPFYAAFQKYINLRESCYECMYSGEQRYSDITIGDFHDIEKYVENVNRFDGVSTVVINTQRGLELWNQCLSSLTVFQMDLEKLKSDKILFCGGTKRPSNRDEFIYDYENNEF